MTIVVTTLRLKVFRAQILHRRLDFETAEVPSSETQRKLIAHRKRLLSASKSIQMIYGSMLVGLLECLPLGNLKHIGQLETMAIQTSKQAHHGNPCCRCPANYILPTGIVQGNLDDLTFVDHVSAFTAPSSFSLFVT